MKAWPDGRQFTFVVVVVILTTVLLCVTGGHPMVFVNTVIFIWPAGENAAIK